MRYYREMPTEAEKRKVLLAKAEVEKIDKKVLSKFAAYVDRLEFKFNEI